MKFNTRIVEKLAPKKAGKTWYVALKHSPTNGPRKGQETTVGTLITSLSAEAKELLKTLNAGEIVGMEIEKVETEKFKGWTLKDVTKSLHDVEDTGKDGSKSRDNVGVKVGAARNQALAALSIASTHANATFSSVKTLEDILNLVDSTAAEIVRRQAAQEEAVRMSQATESIDVTNNISNSDQTNYTTHDIAQDDEIPF